MTEETGAGDLLVPSQNPGAAVVSTVQVAVVQVAVAQVRDEMKVRDGTKVGDEMMTTGARDPVPNIGAALNIVVVVALNNEAQAGARDVMKMVREREVERGANVLPHVAGVNPEGTVAGAAAGAVLGQDVIRTLEEKWKQRTCQDVNSSKSLHIHERDMPHLYGFNFFSKAYGTI